MQSTIKMDYVIGILKVERLQDQAQLDVVKEMKAYWDSEESGTLENPYRELMELELKEYAQKIEQIDKALSLIKEYA